MSEGEVLVRVGVLALQGGYAEHISHLRHCIKTYSEDIALKRCIFEIVEVRSPASLVSLDGLVIPGGESTAMSIFLENEESAFLKELKKFSRTKPVFGTCAGLILLSNEVEGQKEEGQVMVRSNLFFFTKKNTQLTKNFPSFLFYINTFTLVRV
jgi:5'-phosphate synthase pdxT subunit